MASATLRRVGLPAASLLAVLLVTFALGFLIWGETPRGRVEGVVVLTDYAGWPLSGADVYLTPTASTGERRTRSAKTDARGRFALSRVAAGGYTVTASTRYHESETVTVSVEEARAATVSLQLKRSEADINIGDHQSSFTTDEKPFLPVRGYVAASAKPEPGVNTRSSGTLAVRIWRTRLSDVLRRSDAADALDRLRYTYDGATPKMPAAILKAGGARLVGETRVPIKSDDREGFYVERVPLDIARGKPGLYLVEFAHARKAACSFVVVTDLALVTKRTGAEMLGYAVNVRTGKPVAGADVRAYHGGSLLGSATTGADGLATLAVPASANAGATPVAVASKGADEAVVHRAGYWYGEGAGADSYTVHTVFDRTVYRPGDTIQFKGIARRRSGDGAAAYGVPTGVPVFVEVRDPSGALVSRIDTRTNGSGSYWGSAELSPEHATGAYSVVADIAGAKFTAETVVASYRKPEFTVSVTPEKRRYVRGEPVRMTIEGAYYFGAPVAGAKVRYSVFRDADWMATYGVDPEDYDAGDWGDDPRGYFSAGGGAYSNYYGESVADGEATLDENGRAIVTVSSDVSGEGAESRPQAETYTLTATVEDAADRTVEAEGAARVSAGDVLVAVEPEGYVGAPGKPAPVFVTLRDQDGKRLPNARVELSAFFERWDKQKKQSTTEPVGPAIPATTGADGRAVLEVTPTRKGEMRLVATARDSKGRTVRSEAGLWVAGDGGDDLDTDYGDLSLLTDKREYQPGDTARVLVNTSRTGQTILLTVEGDRIYRTYSLPVTKHSTVVSVPVRAEWGPNVTLAACYVRSKKFASSETPLRVSIKARELAVKVAPVGGDRYGPGDVVTYAVETRDAATGRPAPAEFSLSVVDESIYALRADDPKALKRAFYPRRSNRVATAYSFSVEYLGDLSKAEPRIAARRKFRDTAVWKPALRTGADGRTTVAITLPDNLTTWRATVNAVTDATTAVGYGASKVISSKPFFVRLEKPRFLTGGDESRLMALVHNETGRDQTVLVRLQAPSLVLSGGEEQTLTVKAGAIGRAEWTAGVPEGATGHADLRLTAWTPKDAAGGQFTDGVEDTVATRAYGRAEFVTFAGVLSGEAGADAGDRGARQAAPLQNGQGGAVGAPLAAPSPSGIPVTGGALGTLTATPNQAVLRLDPAAVPAETRLTLRVTPSLRGALAGGLEYLIGFPYGCTEQTMSRFYPDLLVRRAGLSSGLKNADHLPRMARDGIARLSKLQHGGSGAWGWWERDADDAFMTAYALLGLAEARAQGFAVEPSLLNRGIEGGVALAKKAPPRDRPFLLYALAMAGYDDRETNLLHAPFRYSKVRTKLDPATLPTDALAYLSLLARKIGADPGAFRAELDRRAAPEGRLLRWERMASVKDAMSPSTSDRMATALALRVLLAENPDDVRIVPALRWLMNGRTDGWFGDTRDTAWVLATFVEYLRLHPEDAARPTGALVVRVNGREVQRVDLATDEPEVVLSLPTGDLRPGPNTLEVVRDGEAGGGGTVFYSGALRQTVAAPKNAELAAAPGQGVRVKREVLRVLSRRDGDLWRLATEPVTDGRFRQGDRLRVRLVVEVDRDTSYVLIEDAFPSGAEPTERGTAEQEFTEGGDSTGYWYDHVDVRDDRIAFFARRLPKGKHVIEYNLRAQTPGVCRALPAHVEAMYDPSVKADSAGARLEVRP